MATLTRKQKAKIESREKLKEILGDRVYQSHQDDKRLGRRRVSLERVIKYGNYSKEAVEFLRDIFKKMNAVGYVPMALCCHRNAVMVSILSDGQATVVTGMSATERQGDLMTFTGGHSWNEYRGERVDITHFCNELDWVYRDEPGLALRWDDKDGVEEYCSQGYHNYIEMGRCQVSKDGQYRDIAKDMNELALIADNAQAYIMDGEPGEGRRQRLKEVRRGLQLQYEGGANV